MDHSYDPLCLSHNTILETALAKSNHWCRHDDAGDGMSPNWFKTPPKHICSSSFVVNLFNPKQLMSLQSAQRT